MSALVKSAVEEAKASPRLNAFERALAQRPQLVMPVTHCFTPGLYTRTIFMEAGAQLISRIHLTEHPFVITKGACLVVYPDGKEELLVAPFMGITQPGTRRAIKILQDCTWSTFHPTNKTTVAEVEKEILEPQEKADTPDGKSCVPEGQIIHFSPAREELK